MDFLIPDSIDSQRLRLRRVGEADWQDLHGYYSDPAATRFTVQEALSEEGSRKMVAAMIRHWELRRYGPYVLVDKSSGNVLGVCGPSFPKGWPEPEIKWALIPRHQGRGYASEAARAVQAMAARHMPGRPLISLIHPDNTPSVTLANAVGATWERNIEFRGCAHGVYRHPRPGS